MGTAIPACKDWSWQTARMRSIWTQRARRQHQQCVVERSEHSMALRLLWSSTALLARFSRLDLVLPLDTIVRSERVGLTILCATHLHLNQTQAQVMASELARSYKSPVAMGNWQTRWCGHTQAAVRNLHTGGSRSWVVSHWTGAEMRFGSGSE